MQPRYPPPFIKITNLCLQSSYQEEQMKLKYVCMAISLIPRQGGRRETAWYRMHNHSQKNLYVWKLLVKSKHIHLIYYCIIERYSHLQCCTLHRGRRGINPTLTDHVNRLCYGLLVSQARPTNPSTNRFEYTCPVPNIESNPHCG